MTTRQRQIPTAQLGRNGPQVSRLALGTMTFGAETDEREAFKQLDIFSDHGGTLVDTADVYSDGVSEAIIGRWGRQRGGFDDIILSTKCRFAPPPGSHGGSRRAIIKSAEASLRRLQTQAIDVYHVHGWDRHTDITETLTALGDLVTAGKVHNIAWSNVSGWQMQKIITTATLLNAPMPVALQPQYNLLERGIEMEVLPCCLENGIALIPWSPLGGGWLTGKYSAQQPPEGSTRLGEDPHRGVEAYDLRNTPRTWRIIDALGNIAERLERPMSQVALAWLLSRPGVASLLLGARTAEQLESNLGAADLVLDDSDLHALTGVSAPALPAYPYDFLAAWSDMRIWQELGTR